MRFVQSGLHLALSALCPNMKLIRDSLWSIETYGASATGIHSYGRRTYGHCVGDSSPPPTLQEGTPSLDSNTITWVFPERGPIQLPNDLVVNRTIAGLFDSSSKRTQEFRRARGYAVTTCMPIAWTTMGVPGGDGKLGVSTTDTSGTGNSAAARMTTT